MFIIDLKKQSMGNVFKLSSAKWCFFFVFDELCCFDKSVCNIILYLTTDITVFQQYMTKSHVPGVLTSMTNWLSGNIGLPPLIDGNLCGEFPWVMYYIISAETEWEMQSEFWPTLFEHIIFKDVLNVDANAYKVTRVFGSVWIIRHYYVCFFQWK